MSICHKALASQLLAGLGTGKAIKYGPLSGKELKTAREANPRGYFTLLADAINKSRAPAFAGGSLKKAALLLEALSKNFPDSSAVKIHLAEAYGRLGRRDEAQALILPIVKSNPSDLFAAMVAAKLREK
jgi:predicted Zn-dependent protease